MWCIFQVIFALAIGSWYSFSLSQGFVSCIAVLVQFEKNKIHNEIKFLLGITRKVYNFSDFIGRNMWLYHWQITSAVVLRDPLVLLWSISHIASVHQELWQPKEGRFWHAIFCLYYILSPCIPVFCWQIVREVISLDYMVMISFYKTKQKKQAKRNCFWQKMIPLLRRKKLLDVKLNAYQNEYNRIWQQIIDDN